MTCVIFGLMSLLKPGTVLFSSGVKHGQTFMTISNFNEYLAGGFKYFFIFTPT